MEKDIRWTQRFSNFQKAIIQLKEAIDLFHQRALSKLEEQGLIQCFEYTYELGWKTIRDFLQNHGSAEIYGSKDAVREGFRLGIIQDGQGWMDMIKSRNQTSHIYDEQAVKEIVNLIIKDYYSLLLSLEKTLDAKMR